jgi:hypothetical protein
LTEMHHCNSPGSTTMFRVVSSFHRLVFTARDPRGFNTQWRGPKANGSPSHQTLIFFGGVFNPFP